MIQVHIGRTDHLDWLERVSEQICHQVDLHSETTAVPVTTPKDRFPCLTLKDEFLKDVLKEMVAVGIPGALEIIR